MIRVLFICTHNSARSQMAEAYLRKFGADRFFTESAGLEPGALNPFVVRALQEEGIDISGKKTQSVFDLYKEGRHYQYVVAVCSREAEEKCPIFPGITKRLHWPFDDPSTFKGSDEEIMTRVRIIRDAIKDRVREFIDVVGTSA
ncbi:MAG: arsenate reductase ArsC [Rectinemataceae bacterium]